MGVNLNDRIPIVCQLEDGNTARFVQAVVRGPDGVILNTVACPHVGNGLYINDTVVMPNVRFVTVQFRVFSNVELTVLDPQYSQPMDFFDLDESTNVIDRLDQIEDNIDSSDGRLT